MSAEWTLWSERRPEDTTALYRWRVPTHPILGMDLRPEWTAKLVSVGMGYADNEWWPAFSDWNGYSRTLPPGTEWRLAEPDEDEIFWGGMDLLPCPFTGNPPLVSYHGRWIGAPPYCPEWLALKSWMVDSNGWRDAQRMVDAWNRRPVQEAT